MEQVAFLTVNHRGLLPLREFHSTCETLVWRGRGGSWACLRPVHNYEWNYSTCQRLLQFCFIIIIILTLLNHRNASLERPLGILGLFPTRFRLSKADTQTCGPQLKYHHATRTQTPSVVLWTNVRYLWATVNVRSHWSFFPAKPWTSVCSFCCPTVPIVLHACRHTNLATRMGFCARMCLVMTVVYVLFLHLHWIVSICFTVC